jgi:chromosomal replication initiator protein
MSHSAIPTDSNDAGQALWQSCIDLLAQELPEQQFNTWIKPLQANVSDDFSKLTLVVVNRFKLDWIRAQYAARIHALLAQLYGQPIQLDFALSTKTPIAKHMLSKAPVDAEEFTGILASAPQDTALNGFKNRLNSSLCFDTLVEGTANRMARAAAMHVANVPGQLYNPLFIYGGVGLGKTHLMHAVGNQLLQNKPTPRCSTYMPSNLCQTWSKPTSAKPSTNSSSTTIR